VHRTIFGGHLDPDALSNDVLSLVRAVTDQPTA